MILSHENGTDTRVSHLFGTFWAANKLDSGRFYVLDFYEADDTEDNGWIDGGISASEAIIEVLWGETDREGVYRGAWSQEPPDVEPYWWTLPRNIGDYS